MILKKIEEEEKNFMPHNVGDFFAETGFIFASLIWLCIFVFPSGVTKKFNLVKLEKKLHFNSGFNS